MKITNNSNISLSLAVWLIHDQYDYGAGKDFKEYISVTTLMRPTKQIVLARRVPPEQQVEDVEQYIARGLGNSIHDSIEKAWTQSYQINLRKLGYPQSVIDLVAINPTDAERLANPDMIPVYLEQRGFREINGVTIGGKFDLVAEGHVEDNKSTSAWGWVFGTRDDENQLQGSLYRWIDADREVRRITEDYIRVNYIFTDWQKMQARSNPKYPQKRVEHKDIPLLSLEDTELYVKSKLYDIKKNMNLPEEAMVECSDEDIWRSDPQYKYYADPTKTAGRSTKNFETLVEANAFMAEKGGKGIVKTILGEPKRCQQYCGAYSICKQKDRYFS